LDKGKKLLWLLDKGKKYSLLMSCGLVPMTNNILLQAVNFGSIN
jgi:hypothetical protein